MSEHIDPYWVIEARLKGGFWWEPVSVEARILAGRRYSYSDLEQAKAAFQKFIGRDSLLHSYEIRFARVDTVEAFDSTFVHPPDTKIPW